MEAGIRNKIEATDTNLFTLLKGNKFIIDYFQREYRWRQREIEQLVDDLTTTFLKAYQPTHDRQAVAEYPKYYLGSVVFYRNAEQKTSIIDGQQRITSISLFLIYLNHLQIGRGSKRVAIDEMIYAEMYGEMSFVLSDTDREACLRALFETGEYTLQRDDNETVENLLACYGYIRNAFPDERIGTQELPYFIDWLIRNVILATVTAYSEENAYTIFETMNDRGLSLSQTEMLKSFVISRVTGSRANREKIDSIWKRQMQALHKMNDKADISFFQAWFRGKYALAMRSGDEDKDFELIASQFHKWFKDNEAETFCLTSAEKYFNFFNVDFPFYAEWYIRMQNAFMQYNPKMPHLYYAANLGFASSLREPLIMAVIHREDDEDTIQKKMDLAARYLEAFAVRRLVNNRRFGQSAIKSGIFRVITLIRNNDTETLIHNLNSELQKIAADFSWSGLWKLTLNQQNKKYIKHILCRISSYVDQLVGDDVTYKNYYAPDGKPYEIEHLWSDKYTQYRDECADLDEFKWYRNLIGALILLQRGPNQSFGSALYEDKLEHYIKSTANVYAKTLHPIFYVRNPNFLKNERVQAIGFTAHPSMKKADINQRIEVLQKLCEVIWGAAE